MAGDYANFSTDYDNVTEMRRFNDNKCFDYKNTLQTFSNIFYKHPGFIRPLVIVLYTIVACFGAAGNTLVIAAIVRNPQMRILRNFFIVNLALSDLTLCTFTVPMTAFLTVNRFWIFGEVTCKLTSFGTAVNLFVSSMSITAIGFDRYWAILFPTKLYQQRMVIGICFASIWILSLTLSSPQYFRTRVRSREYCGVHLEACEEDWANYPSLQRTFTIGCMIFQYILPLTMLTFLYGRIMMRLQERMIFNRPSTFDDGKRVRTVESRHRRTNSLLICIVLIFAIGWLPFNLFNIINAFTDKYVVVAFAFSHIIGIISACANPILYGVYNENFRNEFIEILTILKVYPVYTWTKKFLILRFKGRIALEAYLQRQAQRRARKRKARSSTTACSRYSSNGVHDSTDNLSRHYYSSKPNTPLTPALLPRNSHYQRPLLAASSPTNLSSHSYVQMRRDSTIATTDRLSESTDSKFSERNNSARPSQAPCPRRPLTLFNNADEEAGFLRWLGGVSAKEGRRQSQAFRKSLSDGGYPLTTQPHRNLDEGVGNCTTQGVEESTPLFGENCAGTKVSMNNKTLNYNANHTQDHDEKKIVVPTISVEEVCL
uniref:G-protein coupled receptors family 1 profile domain-containing protein n=1 Tax=Romanomermis culicivorax TaxID=13658 RepID=A0A915IMF9_ROMCU